MNGAIAWFARNPVAANLLMVLVLVAGAVTAFTIKEEVFPEFSADLITVSVLHPGASPAEVEEGACILVEEELQGLDGIKRVSSVASEGLGVVSIELLSDADPRKVLDDVKARVDAIDTFPEEAEEPVVEEVVLRQQVLNVAVHGSLDERTLKSVGERVRDEIANLPGITQVQLASARPYEIAIEVSEADLRRYGLTFDEVAAAVRATSLDLPGGSVRTEAGEILLRTKGRARRGREFEEIVLRTRSDGTRLLVGDVATVVDGFAETDQAARFDGEPAVMVQVFRIGEQSALDVSRTVHGYVEGAREILPDGVALTVWQDDAKILRSRLDTLLRNGRSGLVLVFIVLALFLRLRLAFWVSLGIPISFLGAIALMPVMDVSVNLLSLFAFIVVLGIVVDDAIVVGENVHVKRGEGLAPLEAAIVGAQEVSVPVTFAVLTSVVAFVPMMVVPGTTGKIWRVIPMIVIATLLFSWLESKLILPAHLAHERADGPPSPARGGAWSRFQAAFARAVERFALRIYRPGLEWCLARRYLTLAAVAFTFLLTVGAVGGGWVRRVFMPPVEADFVFAALTMPQGTPATTTAQAVRRLEEAAGTVSREVEGRDVGEGGMVRHVLSAIGEQPQRGAQQGNGGGLPGSFVGAHLGEVTLELAPAEERELTSAEIARRWREATGPIPGVVELTFSSSLFSAGDAIHVQLRGREVTELRRAAEELKETLRAFPGVIDIADSHRPGKQEVELAILPEAQALGLTQADLAVQVRQAFHGEEAQRIQRGRDEVKVMVRYPRESRGSIGDLQDMRIRTAVGTEVPFTSVARAELSRGPATIRRSDRMRAIDVTADIASGGVNANEILAQLEEAVLPALLAGHPGVSYRFEGERREQSEVLGGLFRGFGLALVAIYGLMAIPFRSYTQPLIIMSVIPFGLVGAVAGHVLMGRDLSVLSMCGMVALAGVVVNDSLVLVDFTNRQRRAGASLHHAIRAAGTARFRPILLTSLTTFAGLTPLLLERSVQAQFLVPMAISLAFGVLFATFLSLVIVPAGYLVLEDAHALATRIAGALRGQRERPSARSARLTD